MEERVQPIPECKDLGHIFYSPEPDGRNETGREDRENRAKAICFTCPYRHRCLEKAMVWREKHGVWGGMSEAERRDFRQHLRNLGYGAEVPTGIDFRAAVGTYYSIRYQDAG